LIRRSTVPKVAVKDKHRARPRGYDLLIRMAASRIRKLFWRLTQQQMSSGHNSSCAILVGEIVQEPDSGYNSKGLAAETSGPVGVQTLLPESRQWVSAADLTDPEFVPQNVIHRSQRSGICVKYLEDPIAVCKIVNMTRTALFEYS